MLKMFRKLASYLWWQLTDSGMEIVREDMPCADGVYHTNYSLVRSARSTAVYPFPEANFLLLRLEHQLLERKLIESMGYKLEVERPKALKIEFFCYYGESSMALNNELLNLLTMGDVAHLSESERAFFTLFKQQGGDLMIHSGSCVGPRPTQEDECRGMLSVLRKEHLLHSGAVQQIPDGVEIC